MITTLQDVRDFVRNRLDVANRVAESAGLERRTLTASVEMYNKSFSLNEHIQIPEMPLGFGTKAWAAILFVDLRNSSKRAEKYGERDTYLTMHAYLPTMAHLVSQASGIVVGYRGDGLFAAFGLSLEGTNSIALNEGHEVRNAVDCAKSMIEAVDEAVEPELRSYDVPGDLQVGCGIDASKVVLTRIGLHENSESTAYGNAVNKASKLSGGSGEVVVSAGARNLYPKGKGGRIGFARHWKLEGLRVEFPSGYQVLQRETVAAAR